MAYERLSLGVSISAGIPDFRSPERGALTFVRLMGDGGIEFPSGLHNVIFPGKRSEYVSDSDSDSMMPGTKTESHLKEKEKEDKRACTGRTTGC